MRGRGKLHANGITQRTRCADDVEIHVNKGRSANGYSVQHNALGYVACMRQRDGVARHVQPGRVEQAKRVQQNSYHGTSSIKIGHDDLIAHRKGVEQNVNDGLLWEVMCNAQRAVREGAALNINVHWGSGREGSRPPLEFEGKEVATGAALKSDIQPLPA